MAIYKVLITGTHPESRRGGIAVALPGYFAAMEKAGIEYIFVPTHHATEKGGKWLFWLKAFPIIWKNTNGNRDDKKHTVIYTHPGAGISLVRQSILMAFFRFRGINTIMQIHSMDIDRYLDRPLLKLFFRLAIRPATMLAVLTPWWVDRLNEAGVNKRVFVIPNPLPIKLEALAHSKTLLKTKDDELMVLTMCRIEPGKGVSAVIEAIRFLPDGIKLIVAGEGSRLAGIKKRAQVLGIDHKVKFVGWVSGEEKQQLLDSADVFCLPSSYDAFGMVFVEAMSNGIPIIGLDSGPIPDVVPKGVCGILVPDKDPIILAEAIKQMLDVHLRQKMSSDAKYWVLNEYGSGHVGKLIKSMLDEIVKERME